MARQRGPSYNTIPSLEVKPEDDFTIDPEYKGGRIKGPGRGTVQVTPDQQEETIAVQETDQILEEDNPVMEIDTALKESEPTTLVEKLNSAVGKIMNMQDTDPEKYSQMLSGIDLYLRGQDGKNIAQAFFENQQYNAEQASALIQSAKVRNDLRLQELKIQKAEADVGAKLAPGLTYGQGLIPQIENRITAEYFPGVDKDTIPARQISSLASMLTQDVNEMVKSGMGLNEAIDRAMKIAESQGALSKGKIQERRFMFDKQIPPRADASKYTAKVYSMKALLARNKDATEEEIRAAVNAQPNATLID